MKDSPLPSDPDDPKNARAREVIAAAQADHRGSVRARMWVYRSVTAPIDVAVDFTSRVGQPAGPAGLRRGLLADCYAHGRSPGGEQHAASAHTCVAHARRKVFEARGNHPVHASVLLAMFEEFYDIEDRAKNILPRFGVSQAESPRVDGMRNA